MINRFEITYIRWIKNQPRGFFSGVIKACLRVVSWAYHLTSSVRNWLFDHGWLRQYSPPVPVVISIGNIVAGGTGKTPVTQMIAEEFYSQFQLAILSRGYRSKVEKRAKPTILSKGKGPLYSASHCGDEPYLLAKNLPRAFVYVGKDRLRSSNMAAQDGADLILLDDGMQHRFLARDFEVVIIDAQDPFGQGYFIPRGFLRDNLRSLSRADLIVVNHVASDNRFASIVKQIEQHSCAPVVRTVMELQSLLDLEDLAIEGLSGQKVALFCAIANPDNFIETVSQLGADIVLKRCLADHRNFSKESLEKFCKKARDLGAQMLVCTEKDRVKIPNQLELSLPIVWLKMRLRLVEGECAFRAFIDKAKQNLTAVT